MFTHVLAFVIYRGPGRVLDLPEEREGSQSPANKSLPIDVLVCAGSEFARALRSCRGLFPTIVLCLPRRRPRSTGSGSLARVFSCAGARRFKYGFRQNEFLMSNGAVSWKKSIEGDFFVLRLRHPLAPFHGYFFAVGTVLTPASTISSKT